MASIPAIRGVSFDFGEKLIGEISKALQMFLLGWINFLEFAKSVHRRSWKFLARTLFPHNGTPMTCLSHLSDFQISRIRKRCGTSNTNGNQRLNPYCLIWTCLVAKRFPVPSIRNQVHPPACMGSISTNVLRCDKVVRVAAHGVDLQKSYPHQTHVH